MWHDKWLQPGVTRAHQSARAQLTGKQGYNATHNKPMGLDNPGRDSSDGGQVVCPGQYL